MGIGAAMMGASALSGAGSIFGGIMGANAQSEAAQDAMRQEMKMFGIGQAGLQPFQQFGQQAGNQLMQMLGIGGNSNAQGYGSLLKAFNPTMEQLQQTPGYKFALDTGLKSTQNGYAARGLGASGNAMRGAADYSEGLASTTYQEQFQNDLMQKQNWFNMLSGTMNTGAGAAEGLMTGAMGLGGMLGQNEMAIGNAQAGMWNNIGAGIGQIGSAPMSGMMGQAQYNMMNNMGNYYGQGGGGGTGGYGANGLWGTG